MLRLLSLLLMLPLIACPEAGELADDDDTSVPGDDDDAAPDDDDAAPGIVAQEVSITTADGLTLSGTFRAQEGASSGPAALLLHQFGRDRDDFVLVRDGLDEAGIATLAIDFRSHGDSDPAPVDFTSLVSDPTQLPEDVQASLAWLAARDEVDAARVGVFGLSVGANLAVVANHNRAAWGVKTTVAVSARMERVLELADVGTLSLESAIYIAADEEDPQGDDADALGALTAEPVSVRRVLGTTAHGVDLLAASANVRDGTVEWLVKNL